MIPINYKIMNKAHIFTILPFVMAAAFAPELMASSQVVSKNVVPSGSEKNRYVTKLDSLQAANDSLISLIKELEPEKSKAREVAEIINSLGEPDFKPTAVNKVLAPWVFSGYRHLLKKTFDTTIPVYLDGMGVMTASSETSQLDSIAALESIFEPMDSLAQAPEVYVESFEETPQKKEIDILAEDVTPKWLRDALTSYRIQEDFIYSNMVANPKSIEYTYWDLPVPPRLPEEDVSFAAFLKKLDLPEVETSKAQLVEQEVKKIHWLHNVNGSMQFSQSYLSSNWYQGGNNNVSLFFNFNWNVQLNPVYHPKYIFSSNLNYKLGLMSTPQDEVRDFSLSQDWLEHTINVGIKAIKKWYYSINTRFTTQLFNNYQSNSHTRKASFLSPADFNLGIGMTYETSYKTRHFKISINPLSYNLKMCMAKNDVIPHSWFGIDDDKHTKSDIGSNFTADFDWQIMWNIRYNTHLYTFTNYDYIMWDWQHNISFEVNKFLTTSIFLNFRFDSSLDPTTSDWKKFMMKEVLGFGLTYTFATKR